MAAVARQPRQPSATAAVAPAAGVRFRPLVPADLIAVDLQGSQLATGLLEVTLQLAEHLAAGDAWTAIGANGRLLCCAGVQRPLPGWHGAAWAMLAENVGAAHVAITRFARARIAEHPARRIEAMVRSTMPAEQRWAELVGLSFVADLPGWGPEEGGAMLYARVKE